VLSSKWQGFWTESIRYMEPKGFVGWMRFLIRYPGAWRKFRELEVLGNE